MTNVVDIAPRRAAATEAVLREKPSDTLPDPAELFGNVVFDCETSGLYVDDGDRVCAVGVAYRKRDDPDLIWYHSYAFDQGNAADKGFEIRYLLDTPTNRREGTVGLPAGDPFGRWDWETDYNLPALEWTVLCRWLEEAGQAVGLSNQNIKFDVNMMLAGTRFSGGVDLERWVKWDTMHASREVFPFAGTTALKPISSLFWGADEVEEAGVVKEALLEAKKRYGLKPEHGPRYDLIPWEVNGPYAAADGVLTLRLGELQHQTLEEGIAVAEDIERSVALTRVLCRMERRGLGPLDVARAAEVADKIDARIDELKLTLPFEPYTAPRAAKYFFDELGLAPWKVSEQPRVVENVPDKRKGHEGELRETVTKQGDLSAPVAHRMATAGVPHADAWAEITELRIANQMFYRNYADLAGPDGKLRTNFKQSHVRSGRLSVERFQAQALPKKLALHVAGELQIEPKKLFGIEPGKVRMNLDLGQAELRIASHLCGCKVMSDALVTGADFHGMTTERVFSIGPDNPDWSLKRDIAKRLTFGSIFQIGAKKFQATLWELAGIEWSLRECYAAVNAWRSAYPEFGVAYEQWMQFAERNKYVPLYNGRPSWLAGPRDYPNTAWNRRVQGSLAQFCTDWLVMIERMTARMDALVLTVHDSVVLDLPEARAEEVCAEIKVATESLWEKTFNIPGKLDVGAWQKAA